MFVGIRGILFLIALVMGYLLLFLSRAEENWQRRVGGIIGLTVIIVSTAYILSNPRMYAWIRPPIIDAQSHNNIIYRLFTAISDNLFLIAFFLGYSLLFLARREEKWRRFAGYAVGSIIMLVSTVYMLLNFMVYSCIFHPTQSQPPAKTTAERMRLYKGVQPWLPEEIPQY